MVLPDDSYIPDLERIAKELQVPIKVTDKTPVADSMLFKTIALVLKQQSF